MRIPGFDEPREVHAARQRRPETYDSVSAWWNDYRGFVPIQRAYGLSQLTQPGMSFQDIYVTLLGKHKIIEIDSLRADAPHWAESDARLVDRRAIEGDDDN